MEGQAPEVTVAPVATAPVATPVAPTPQTAPAPQVIEEGGAFEGKTKWRMVDILIMSLWIIVPIYGIIYYRKAIKKLDEQPTTDEFDNMVGDIEEVKYNVKKALGGKYKNT
jgi:hypothetical protein